jgi:hypothetical protein
MRTVVTLAALTHTLLNGVLARAELTLDEHEAADVKVVCDGLGRLAPDDDAVPLGALPELPLLVVPGLIGGDRKACDRCAGLGATELRLAAEVADQFDVIAGRHIWSPFDWG